ncbi:MAG: hypothetical protein KC652_17400, partial [Cyanobacteria bacterium HKST-UBA01]|nr:hypothetical protein [Cyanobacteria bacterium HKST-UBA01]
MGLIVDSGQRSTDALISLRKKGEADRDSDIEKKEEVVSKPETLQEEEPEKTIRCKFCDHDIT